MKGLIIRTLFVLSNRIRIGITSRNATLVRVGIDGLTAFWQDKEVTAPQILNSINWAASNK